MTPQEFKAWFDGFTENCDGPPNEKQWDRIKARVAEINGVSITYPVYVDRYWPQYPPRYWYSGCAQTNNNLGGGLGGSTTYSNTQLHSLLNQTVSNNFDSAAAMYEAGRADADQIN